MQQGQSPENLSKDSRPTDGQKPNWLKRTINSAIGRGKPKATSGIPGEAPSSVPPESKVTNPLASGELGNPTATKEVPKTPDLSGISAADLASLGEPSSPAAAGVDILREVSETHRASAEATKKQLGDTPAEPGVPLFLADRTRAETPVGGIPPESQELDMPPAENIPIGSARPGMVPIPLEELVGDVSAGKLPLPAGAHQFVGGRGKQPESTPTGLKRVDLVHNPSAKSFEDASLEEEPLYTEEAPRGEGRKEPGSLAKIARNNRLVPIADKKEERSPLAPAVPPPLNREATPSVGNELEENEDREKAGLAQRFKGTFIDAGSIKPTIPPSVLPWEDKPRDVGDGSESDSPRSKVPKRASALHQEVVSSFPASEEPNEEGFESRAGSSVGSSVGGVSGEEGEKMTLNPSLVTPVEERAFSKIPVVVSETPERVVPPVDIPGALPRPPIVSAEPGTPSVKPPVPVVSSEPIGKVPDIIAPELPRRLPRWKRLITRKDREPTLSELAEKAKKRRERDEKRAARKATSKKPATPSVSAASASSTPEPTKAATRPVAPKVSKPVGPFPPVGSPAAPSKTRIEPPVGPATRTPEPTLPLKKEPVAPAQPRPKQRTQNPARQAGPVGSPRPTDNAQATVRIAPASPDRTPPPPVALPPTSPQPDRQERPRGIKGIFAHVKEYQRVKQQERGFFNKIAHGMLDPLLTYVHAIRLQRFVAEQHRAGREPILNDALVKGVLDIRGKPRPELISRSVTSAARAHERILSGVVAGNAQEYYPAQVALAREVVAASIRAVLTPDNTPAAAAAQTALAEIRRRNPGLSDDDILAVQQAAKDIFDLGEAVGIKFQTPDSFVATVTDQLVFGGLSPEQQVLARRVARLQHLSAAGVALRFALAPATAGASVWASVAANAGISVASRIATLHGQGAVFNFNQERHAQVQNVHAVQPGAVMRVFARSRLARWMSVDWEQQGSASFGWQIWRAALSGAAVGAAFKGAEHLGDMTHALGDTLGGMLPHPSGGGEVPLPSGSLHDVVIGGNHYEVPGDVHFNQSNHDLYFTDNGREVDIAHVDANGIHDLNGYHVAEMQQPGGSESLIDYLHGHGSQHIDSSHHEIFVDQREYEAYVKANADGSVDLTLPPTDNAIGIPQPDGSIEMLHFDPSALHTNAEGVMTVHLTQGDPMYHVLVPDSQAMHQFYLDKPDGGTMLDGVHNNATITYLTGHYNGSNFVQHATVNGTASLPDHMNGSETVISVTHPGGGGEMTGPTEEILVPQSNAELQVPEGWHFGSIDQHQDPSVLYDSAGDRVADHFSVGNDGIHFQYDQAFAQAHGLDSAHEQIISGPQGETETFNDFVTEHSSHTLQINAPSSELPAGGHEAWGMTDSTDGNTFTIHAYDSLGDRANALTVNIDGHNVVFLPTSHVDGHPEWQFTPGDTTHLVTLWKDGQEIQVTSDQAAAMLHITHGELQNWLTSGHPAGVSSDWDYQYGQGILGHNVTFGYLNKDTGVMDPLGVIRGHAAQNGELSNTTFGEPVYTFPGSGASIEGGEEVFATAPGQAVHDFFDEVVGDNAARVTDWVVEHPIMTAGVAAALAGGFVMGRRRADRFFAGSELGLGVGLAFAPAYIIPGYPVALALGYLAGRVRQGHRQGGQGRGGQGNQGNRPRGRGRMPTEFKALDDFGVKAPTRPGVTTGGPGPSAQGTPSVTPIPTSGSGQSAQTQNQGAIPVVQPAQRQANPSANSPTSGGIASRPTTPLPTGYVASATAQPTAAAGTPPSGRAGTPAPANVPTAAVVSANAPVASGTSPLEATVAGMVPEGAETITPPPSPEFFESRTPATTSESTSNRVEATAEVKSGLPPSGSPELPLSGGKMEAASGVDMGEKPLVLNEQLRALLADTLTTHRDFSERFGIEGEQGLGAVTPEEFVSKLGGVINPEELQYEILALSHPPRSVNLDTLEQIIDQHLSDEKLEDIMVWRFNQRISPTFTYEEVFGTLPDNWGEKVPSVPRAGSVSEEERKRFEDESGKIKRNNYATYIVKHMISSSGGRLVLLDLKEKLNKIPYDVRPNNMARSFAMRIPFRSVQEVLRRLGVTKAGFSRNRERLQRVINAVAVNHPEVTSEQDLIKLLDELPRGEPREYSGLNEDSKEDQFRYLYDAACLAANDSTDSAIAIAKFIRYHEEQAEAKKKMKNP